MISYTVLAHLLFSQACIPDKQTPWHPKKKSVHYSNIRFEKAKEQAEMVPVPVPEIIHLVNEFLCQMDMTPCEKPIIGYVMW